MEDIDIDMIETQDNTLSKGKKYVWEFTNQRKLTKGEFIDYFEKKVFKTIRKHGMMPEDRIFRMKDDSGLNFKILKSILETKFIVEISNKPNILSENLSDVSEVVFSNVLSGKFKGPSPEDKPSRPLYFHSDAEIETYAKIKNISGEIPVRDNKIQNLLNRFRCKNPDLDINVVNALAQIQ